MTFKGAARLQYKRRQNGQVKRRRPVSQGAQGAERGGVRGEGVPLPTNRGRGLGTGLDPSLENFLLFALKMEYFGAVFKLDLTEETETQLKRRRQLPPLASYWLRL